jgi:mRNA interferase HigB
MHIITKKALEEYAKKDPELAKALRIWYGLAKRAKWNNPLDIRAFDPKASILPNNRVVFNILGGRYRLVAAIRYKSKVLFIRFVGSHVEYDKIDATTV